MRSRIRLAEAARGSGGRATFCIFTYVIRIPKRDQSAKALYDRGIYMMLRYHPLHMNRIYNSDAKLPNSEQLNLDALSIPLHPNLSDADFEKIITV